MWSRVCASSLSLRTLSTAAPVVPEASREAVVSLTLYRALLRAAGTYTAELSRLPSFIDDVEYEMLVDKYLWATRDEDTSGEASRQSQRRIKMPAKRSVRAAIALGERDADPVLDLLVQEPKLDLRNRTHMQAAIRESFENNKRPPQSAISVGLRVLAHLVERSEDLNTVQLNKKADVTKGEFRVKATTMFREPLQRGSFFSYHIEVENLAREAFTILGVRVKSIDHLGTRPRRKSKWKGCMEEVSAGRTYSLEEAIVSRTPVGIATAVVRVVDSNDTLHEIAVPSVSMIAALSSPWKGTVPAVSTEDSDYLLEGLRGLPDEDRSNMPVVVTISHPGGGLGGRFHDDDDDDDDDVVGLADGDESDESDESSEFDGVDGTSVSGGEGGVGRLR